MTELAWKRRVRESLVRRRCQLAGAPACAWVVEVWISNSVPSVLCSGAGPVGRGGRWGRWGLRAGDQVENDWQGQLSGADDQSPSDHDGGGEGRLTREVKVGMHGDAGAGYPGKVR